MKTKHLLLFIAMACFSCQQNTSSNHLSDHAIPEPEIFLPGIVSTEHMEFGMTISPIDSKTIFFTRRIDDGKQKIYETRFKDGTWTTPQIASFSTDRDESAHFSSDGKTLYFGSERAITGRPNLGNFDMNVWQTTWKGSEWSTPTPLPNTINDVQKEGEKWPMANMSDWVTHDDITFYTGTFQRGEKGIDLYKSVRKDGKFSQLEKLPKEICSDETWEYAPLISPDGQYLFFQVYNRKDGLGGDDIFVSKKSSDGTWLSSVNLGSMINTDMNECPSAMTSDGKYFFFTRDIKEDPKEYDGIPSIYIVETDALQLESLFEKS
jgi:Tol biopolymer transport system component